MKVIYKNGLVIRQEYFQLSTIKIVGRKMEINQE